MGKADVSGKWLFGDAPEDWVRWMLADPTLEVEEFLSAEFQHVLRHSDSLLRVRDMQGPFLLLVELQLHYDPGMPWRMQAYAALAEEKYKLPAYPLVFYLLPPSPSVSLPDRYYSEFRDLVARRDFRVVKAWELEARAVVERGPVKETKVLRQLLVDAASAESIDEFRNSLEVAVATTMMPVSSAPV